MERFKPARPAVYLAGVVLLFSCGMHKPVPARLQPTVAATAESQENAMKIMSSDFAAGKPIPIRFTCEGENISPALTWSGVPAAAKSLALVCDDPDAPKGTWVHWIVVNLPPTLEELPAGGPLPAQAVEVETDFGRPGYGGPCPPSGTHRYFFKLFALDIDSLTGLNRLNFVAEINRHSIATAQYMGTYQAK